MFDEVVAAREQMRAAGIPLGCATGRATQIMQPFFDRLAYDGPIVLQNGAEIWQDGRLVTQISLGKERTAALISWARDRDIDLELFAGDHWYVSDLAAFSPEQLQHLDDESIPDPEPFPSEPFDAVKGTALIYSHDSSIGIYESLLEIGLEAEEHLVPTESGRYYVNITVPEATKGTALERAAELAGATAATSLAVGDGANDITMLRVAGTAVAMGQAIDEVKAYAHFIAPDVDNFGAAAAMEFAANGAYLAAR